MQDERRLYRGKRMDNGEWETGFLVIERFSCSDSEHFITDKMTGYHTPVDPTTAGRCTGLRDKNDMLIFEGDIVVVDEWDDPFPIKWAFYGWCYDALDNFEYLYEFDSDTIEIVGNIEIIGNIYDNPDLLKVEVLS